MAIEIADFVGGCLAFKNGNPATLILALGFDRATFERYDVGRFRIKTTPTLPATPTVQPGIVVGTQVFTFLDGFGSVFASVGVVNGEEGWMYIDCYDSTNSPTNNGFNVSVIAFRLPVQS